MDYYNVHKKLIIKAIEELAFEELFELEQENSLYFLKLENDIQYEFSASIGIWGNLKIEFNTFVKKYKSLVVNNFTIYAFLKEIKKLTDMSDQTLAGYIEEANQTIFSDIQILENLKYFDFSSREFKYVDQMLAGHPKLIMNKGRIGWGEEEIIKYSPEFTQTFQLIWIAVHKDIISIGKNENCNLTNLYTDAQIDTAEVDLDNYVVMPVHPWQWNKYIKIQYCEEIFKNNIIELGARGDEFMAQASVRTLSNVKENALYDIKTSVSILNTSCVRGIPSKYIENGHRISQKMINIIDKDLFLNNKVDVLAEVAAVHISNRSFEDINCSYRFHELLGCVWRESVKSKLKANEYAIPVAALLIDNTDNSLFENILTQSSLSTTEWIQHYFNKVIIPLYHLQVKHGLGLVSHGQNIILKFTDEMPIGIIIKDFHGDLRISKDSIHKNVDEFSMLDQLPENHLIHDLFTGHFISFLRYFSRLLDEKHLVNEFEFYSILANELQKYNNENKPSSNINLLKKNIEKILVNRIRFTAGYDETHTRLKPLLGSDILNPLYTVLKENNANYL